MSLHLVPFDLVPKECTESTGVAFLHAYRHYPALPSRKIEFLRQGQINPDTVLPKVYPTTLRQSIGPLDVN